jgi:cytochrome oxidase Cu insertion factor (SCO1/SenC/PrrC family)
MPMPDQTPLTTTPTCGRIAPKQGGGLPRNTGGGLGRNQRALSAEICTGALVGVAGITWWQIDRIERPTVQTVPETTLAQTIGGPWTLTDQSRHEVTDRTWRGKVEVIYFGYTYCPDACPTELQTIAKALDLLDNDARQVQPLFVTVDPERDTPEHLAEYTAQFHPSLVGLTGTPEQIKAITHAYRVYSARADEKTTGASDYIMDHSSFIYLVGRDGQVVNLLPAGSDPKIMAEAIRAALDRASSKEI